MVNGAGSEWENVTSGILQGSVLGPILFVIYINDLPDTVESDSYLFADDTKIFRIIKGEDDKEILQDDFTKLEEWSGKWLLKFHPEKCKHMKISKSKNEETNTYKLLGQDIETVTQEKYIGVIIDSELTFENHLCEKVKKATSIFAAMRRTFKYLDTKSILVIYNTLVRTHLDYASSVSAPYKMKYIEKIESVQKRVTKQFPGMKNLSYPERLKKLGLPTFAYRRIRGDMIEVYKIIKGCYDREASSFLKLMNETGLRFSSRINSNKVVHQHVKSNKRKYAFTLRVSRRWNKLPDTVVNAPTLRDRPFNLKCGGVGGGL
jgi:hypothetical protein